MAIEILSQFQDEARAITFDFTPLLGDDLTLNVNPEITFTSTIGGDTATITDISRDTDNKKASCILTTPAIAGGAYRKILVEAKATASDGQVFVLKVYVVVR